MLGLKEAAEASFITYAKEDGDSNANTCVSGAIEATTIDGLHRLVWSVVALFPEQGWAKNLNRLRWSIVLDIVDKFKENPTDYTAYTIVGESKKPFSLEDHVDTHKLFVDSGSISLNCSTFVDSDVDVTFHGEHSRFVTAVKDVLLDAAAKSEGSRVFYDKERIKEATGQDVQDAFIAMFDFELFSADHEFQGNNAVVDAANRLVPLMSKATWELSQLRLTENLPRGFTALPYPKTDFYRETPQQDTYHPAPEPGRVDAINSYRLKSDGYYTRPAYMYVVNPSSLAHDDPAISKTNVEVVRNSYRALTMVVLENVGFAMEYVDPYKHGLCPTLQSRAKKIAKYADRVSQALRDVRVILAGHGAGSYVDFGWWELASRGRDPEEGPAAIERAFELDPNAYTSMHANPGLLRQNMESQITRLLFQLRNAPSTVSHVMRIRQSSKSVGGGDDSNIVSRYSWVGLCLAVTILSSLWPRPRFYL